MKPEERPRRTLCVIVPCYNEAQVLDEFHRRMSDAFKALELDCCMLFVDDGSSDASQAVLAVLLQRDPRVGVLRLARNFGKEAALAAGLDHADADLVLIIDADLQDPPEMLAQFLQRFDQGFDMVYGVRRSRAGETWFKRATAAMFYRLIGNLSKTPIPPDTGDFRLLSRRAVTALRQLRERHRFHKGLFGWIGFAQSGLLYDREARAAGSSKWNFSGLFHFAVDGITSFSIAPLRVATYTGVATSLFSFVYGLWIIAKTLLFGEPVRGYPSLMVTILFLGGAQLMALGLIGEYLGRLYEESKQRPLYLIDRYDAARAPAAANIEACGTKQRGA